MQQRTFKSTRRARRWIVPVAGALALTLTMSGHAQAVVAGTNANSNLSGDPLVFGKGGIDVISGTGGADLILPGPDFDIVTAGSGGDTILDDDADLDVLFSQGDDDRIFAANGVADFVECGAGTDLAYVDSFDTVTLAGPEACETVVDASDDLALVNAFHVARAFPALTGLRVGTAGVDNVVGTAGSDQIMTKTGNDNISSLGGDDGILPGAGVDNVSSGDGNDSVFDDDRDMDNISTGNGNDSVFAANGYRDIISCGAGTDIAWADTIDIVSPNCETRNLSAV